MYGCGYPVYGYQSVSNNEGNGNNAIWIILVILIIFFIFGNNNGYGRNN